MGLEHLVKRKHFKFILEMQEKPTQFTKKSVEAKWILSLFLWLFVNS